MQKANNQLIRQTENCWKFFTQLMNLDNVQTDIIQLLGFDNSVYQNLENIFIFDSQIIET